jgi:hypothetical protein
MPSAGGGSTEVVMWLLLAQGLMGAFDTLYYHEHRAPAEVI